MCKRNPEYWVRQNPTPTVSNRYNIIEMDKVIDKNELARDGIPTISKLQHEA